METCWDCCMLGSLGLSVFTSRVHITCIQRGLHDTARKYSGIVTRIGCHGCIAFGETDRRRKKQLLGNHFSIFSWLDQGMEA